MLPGDNYEEPSRFPVLAGGPDRASLKERALLVYRCAQTVIGEFRPATPQARDYRADADFKLALAQHHTRVTFVERIGHWFLMLARSAR